ncbi:MAG: ATP synthase F1 subunit delta [Elusimicrobia bacterium]|nr:ATP synthase F1 subunit delta [Elusimicrobiota bacterium]
MQSSDRVLASRYGKALFLAASAKDEESRVQADLLGATRAILDVMPVLRHPRVLADEKKKKLSGALGGKVSPVTMRFLNLLIDKKRFDLLPAVIAVLGKLIAEKNNTAKAVVRTARPLSAEVQNKLKQGLKEFSGKNVELDVKEDPELIGGLVVRLGDWVLDSSLRGQLRKLRETINGN